MEAVFQIDYRGRLVVAAAAGAVDDLFHLFARYIANQAQFFGQILASLLQHGLILGGQFSGFRESGEALNDFAEGEDVARLKFAKIQVVASGSFARKVRIPTFKMLENLRNLFFFKQRTDHPLFLVEVDHDFQTIVAERGYRELCRLTQDDFLLDGEHGSDTVEGVKDFTSCFYHIHLISDPLRP